jgi:hypothetical protein
MSIQESLSLSGIFLADFFLLCPYKPYMTPFVLSNMFYVFIYGLFNDAVSILDYKASKGNTMREL